MSMENNQLTEYLSEIIEYNNRFLTNETGNIVFQAALALADKITTKFPIYVRESKDYMEEPEGLYLTLFHSPYSYGLVKDLLTGDLSGCYFKLRIMLESLAYCCMIKSDEGYRTGFNYAKFMRFMEKKREDRKSTTKVMKALDSEFGLKKTVSFEHIWRNTSAEYLHPVGPINRFVSAMDNLGTLPVGSLILPARYESADSEVLKILASYIDSFGKVLDTVMPDSR